MAATPHLKPFFQMSTYQLLNILSLVFQVTRSLSRSLIICTFINSSLMSRNRLDLSPLYPPWNPLRAVILDLGTVVLSIREVLPTRTSPLYHLVKIKINPEIITNSKCQKPVYFVRLSALLI